jgi:hypothetical protein
VRSSAQTRTVTAARRPGSFILEAGNASPHALERATAMPTVRPGYAPRPPRNTPPGCGSPPRPSTSSSLSIAVHLTPHEPSSPRYPCTSRGLISFSTSHSMLGTLSIEPSQARSPIHEPVVPTRPHPVSTVALTPAVVKVPIHRRSLPSRVLSPTLARRRRRRGRPRRRMAPRLGDRRVAAPRRGSGHALRVRDRARPRASGRGHPRTRAGASVRGARSVLASLWAVPDRSTRDLIVRFYEGLDRGLAKDEALREARRELLAAGSHPYHWSGFRIPGDFR